MIAQGHDGGAGGASYSFRLLGLHRKRPKPASVQSTKSLALAAVRTGPVVKVAKSVAARLPSRFAAERPSSSRLANGQDAASYRIKHSWTR
jgi:hypothetical protein